MKAILVAGLGFGDESKGATVDKLCRSLPVDLVVRYNGGCQCAHNVVTPEGVHHTFAQFGSGSLANPTVRTHLSRFVLVDPLAMVREAGALKELGVEVWHRTTVDARAVVVTPFHRRLNRLREQARGDERHGSCGRGIGVAREWSLKYGDQVLHVGDLHNYELTKQKCEFLRDLLWRETGVDRLHFCDYELGHLVLDYVRWGYYGNLVRPDADVVGESEFVAVFEGAQGVLLDETHGFQPHVTWTDTTFTNADVLLDEVGTPTTDRTRLGCLRTYHTRHGAGPLPTEDERLLSVLPELHNDTGEFQGAWRVGRFDYDLAQRAVEIVDGVDALAVSHVDRLGVLGVGRTFVPCPGIPIAMWGSGPTADDRVLMEATKWVK